MLAQQIRKRLERADDTSVGAFNLAADIVELCAKAADDATKYTRVSHDRDDIKNLLDTTVEELRNANARSIVPGS
ncbi:MAG TPA: hypothetical protein VMY37_22670 [Thermoguttaceae bacterium]|nr:hypothetical protein [Thermoguttaceae bacterium]HUW59388.1 hypothetical protein [Candidatus Bathyarchaeia archaeon]